MKIFVVNTGSDSRKYALYDGEGKELIRFHLEREGGGYIANTIIGKTKEREDIEKDRYTLSINYVLETMLKKKVVDKVEDISFVGIRVVAPGEYFASNRRVDDEYVSRVSRETIEAPLHIKPILAELEQLRSAMPGIKIYGISDSAFHGNMPAVASNYAIPETDRNIFAIIKYGYHGISIASVINKLRGFGPIPERTIVCHLGSGSSVTALRSGRSVDTSMGYTPLQGLPMGSRVGDIDPGAVIAIGRSKGLNFAELEEYLNTKCGLLALSGKTGDVRELIELGGAGDEGAKLALDSFVYNTKKYIGAYFALLGGLDLLVFTATIGERSSIMRAEICEGLSSLGIKLDQYKNDKMIDKDGLIHDASGSVQIAVVSTDELAEIAREAHALHRVF